MIIRDAIIDDVLIMKEHHDRAIMKLCRNDYTLQQLERWINKSPLEKYCWRLETQRIFIAEQDGRMLGYVRWYPETNELCSICVETKFARQGIGPSLWSMLAHKGITEDPDLIIKLRGYLNYRDVIGQRENQFKINKHPFHLHRRGCQE